MNFLLAKTPLGYIPAFDDDLEKSQKVKIGAVVKCKTEKPRNYELHKKLFKLLSIGFENQEQEENTELYRAKVLIGIGHCDVIFMESGQANFIPKSISYEAIPDDNEFGIIYNKAVEYIANKLMVTNEALAMEVAGHF